LLALILPPAVHPQALDLQQLLDDVRKGARAPGAVLGVLLPDGDLTVVSSGLANREAASLMSPDAAYFLGSISKTYTAVVVMRLAEEGRLSLDDPIARFLPAFPKGSQITIRHLLAHTSGLKDFYSYLYFRPNRQEMIDMVTRHWTPQQLLELAGRFGHWFEPGADWSYSNTNYYLLGVIAERASGVSLPEAYRRYLYKPLQLKSTWLVWHEEPLSTLPVGYMGHVPGWKHSEMFGELGATTLLDRSPVEWGAGGLAASAGDALLFLRALFAGKLLAPASLQAMTDFRSTPALGVPSENQASTSSTDGYGLGLVRMERAGFTLLGHGGLFTGHSTGLWYIPECDTVLTVYFNRGFVDQRAVLDKVVSAIARSPWGKKSCTQPSNP
jgi:D-alanyl-D-alanine carboxypeptidase